MRSLLLLLGLAVFFMPNMTLAQFSTELVGEPVSIILSPQFPNPGESVTATLDDYSINSTGATIIWLIDGVEVISVRNERIVNLTAPKVGESRRLTAKLVFDNQPTLEAQQTISPVYLDLVIEPQTYTPVFYQGRSLPVHGSLVNITALISGSNGLAASANYTYNWQLNNKSVYGGPKKGAYQAQITIPHGRSSALSITVQNETGVTIAKQLIAIPSVPVDLEFYEMSTLYGLSRKAIGGSLNLIGNSSTIFAIPYNLDIRAVTGSLLAEWSIDGRRTLSNSTSPFEINLKREGTGNSRISFQVRNLSELIQSDEQSFQVQF